MLLKFSGGLFIAICLFAFTTGPFYLYHYLGTSNSGFQFRPDAIIQLGGTPLPSETALIRCYYVRNIAQHFPRTTLYVAQLSEKNEKHKQTSAWKMSREIMQSSAIDSSRFRL